MINNIKKKIKDAGYSMKWLAQNKLDIHHTELSNICAGRRRPSNTTLRKLSRILRCKMSDLYKKEGIDNDTRD